MTEFAQRARRNLLHTSSGTIATFAIGFLFSGLTIRYLGQARAGYFLAVNALLGLNILLSDFGVGTAAIREVARRNAAKLPGSGELIGCVAAINLMSATLIGVGVLFFLPRFLPRVGLAEQYHTDATWATLLMVLSFILAQGSMAWRSTYGALERFDLQTAVTATSGLATGLLGIAVLVVAPSMTALASTRLAVSVAAVVADSRLLRRLLGKCPWPTWNWTEIRPLLHFSGWIYVGSLGQFLLGKLNSLILLTFFGATALPLYEIPQRIYKQVHSALSSQAQFLLPMFAAAGADPSVIVRRYEGRMRWLMMLGSAFIYLLIATLGETAIAITAGPEFAQRVRVFLYLACVQGFFQAQDIVLHYAILAAGKSAPNAIIETAQGILVAVSSLMVIPRLGVLGASVSNLWVGVTMVVHVIWLGRILRIQKSISPFVSPTLLLLIAGTVFAWARWTALDPLLRVAVDLGGIALGGVVVAAVEMTVFRHAGNLQAMMAMLKGRSPRRAFQEPIPYAPK